jgi:integrase
MAKKRNPNGVGSYGVTSDGRPRWRLQRNNKNIEISAKTSSELQKKVEAISPLPIVKDKDKHTVDKWFNTWLEVYVKPLKKQATYDQYESIYRKHIKPVIGDYRMTDIRSMDIQRVITEMNKRVHEIKNKKGEVTKRTVGTSTKTMKHAKTVMNCGFEAAFKKAKIIPENPVQDIEIPQKQAKKRKVLSMEEMSSLFKAMANSRWLWSVKFMLVTGLRRGELLALKWSDIDYSNKRITVDESNSSTGLGDTKSGEVHYVPLSEKAIEYLKNQTKMLIGETNPLMVNKDGTLKSDLKGSECLVFPTQKGQMVSPNTYYHLICRYAAKENLKVTPHCFRHTFVYMSRNTLSLKQIQNILGHDESTTTLDIYGDILNESEDTSRQIDEIFANVDKEFEKVQKKKRSASHLKLVK